ncbi:hypothetical protein FNV43_RR00224 [Rhamnella rubrinervis]|uniref:UBX domain-containing protein n=1 Tax=Rhamnella rubrinervis TaxID=2594499 RepID=A0A8K0HNA1_9ROSA|nr:hypothetical protein FNV43_RR00224 [Rhamnella rubrinervis]
MEQSLSSLSYKGSIPAAINEAKNQRKLFVVYISGQDSESNRLENCTWTDVKVAESVTKYCILLHILEGSADAAQFSAIYPQKSVPCITAIGYNGLQLWQNEGFVSAEVLASSLEKVWLSLHIQETTATVLSAALASKKSETSTSGSSSIGPSSQGSSSSTTVQSPLTETNSKLPESTTEENKSHEGTVERKGIYFFIAKLQGVCGLDCYKKLSSGGCFLNIVSLMAKSHGLGTGTVTSSTSFDAKEAESVSEKSNSTTEVLKELKFSTTVDLDNVVAHHISSKAEGSCHVMEEVPDNHQVSDGGSQTVHAEANVVVQGEGDEAVDDKKSDAFDNGMRVKKLTEMAAQQILDNNLRMACGNIVSFSFLL